LRRQNLSRQARTVFGCLLDEAAELGWHRIVYVWCPSTLSRSIFYVCSDESKTAREPPGATLAVTKTWCSAARMAAC